MLGIKKRINLLICQVKWRRNNSHNKTYLDRFPVLTDRICIGNGSYGPVCIVSACKSPHLTIGSYVSIAQDVTFIISAGHRYDCFSTYPFHVMNNLATFEAVEKGGITVGDDVWIGFGATVMDGVTVGRGAIIGARAVVTHDVAPYEIVAGVPAKRIGVRFNRSLIDRLDGLNYSKIDHDFIIEHQFDLESPLDEQVVDRLLSDLNN